MAGSTVQLTTGGAYESGVIFQLTPTVVGEWDFRTLYSFHGQPDVSFPYGALLRAARENFMGPLTTVVEMVSALFNELSPGSTGEWRERVIYSFQSANDGNSPISNLVSDAAAIFMERRVKVVWEVA